MTNKSWFVLELYTPTPKEYTEDFKYNEEQKLFSSVVLQEKNKFIDQHSHYIYIEKTEVGKIEL